MAKKIVKGVAGVFGGKKKKPTADEAGPNVTMLNGADATKVEGRKRRRPPMGGFAGTILSDKLGG